MIFNCLFLALSVSIDSLGIGLTYGIKKIKITFISNVILFLISFCLTCGSIFIGHYISIIFSPFFSKILGASFLMLLGGYNIYKTFNSPPINYDIDNSNCIDSKEALFLGLALSADTVCVGLGSGIIGFSNIILPILVACFQLFFINCGSTISKVIVERINISENGLSIFSSIILILIGILKII